MNNFIAVIHGLYIEVFRFTAACGISLHANPPGGDAAVLSGGRIQFQLFLSTCLKTLRFPALPWRSERMASKSSGVMPCKAMSTNT